MDLVGWTLLMASMGGIGLFITVASMDNRRVERMLEERRLTIARQDALWDMGLMRLTSMRMAWAQMDPGARRTYIELWGEPPWLKDSTGSVELSRW